MTYHPIMGITFFLIFIMIAFLLGRKAYKKASEEKKNSESISPDASWLE